MKHEATLEAENNYTVAEDELARELLPLVKDYFTAEAEETGRGNAARDLHERGKI